MMQTHDTSDAPPVLRHAVGKSTLAEGFSVPKSLESWAEAPEPGQKRSISLLFDGVRAPATLRRLANERGHVQVKYENSEGLPFRTWLGKEFGFSSRAVGDYIEVRRVGVDCFEVTAFPAVRQTQNHLEVQNWLFHRIDESLFDHYAPAREIPAIVRALQFSDKDGQDYYNKLFSEQFSRWKWDAERKVVPELPLKCDFSKDAVQVEVEFGNARTYYQDYIKFMLAYNQRSAELGVLIVPTEDFARKLCEVGRQRALLRGKRSYSGMIHFGKVQRELDYLKFMLSMPLAIAGIGAKR